MTPNESTRTNSSEGVPGLPMLVFIGALFVAAVISTWIVYDHVATTSFFGGTHSGSPVPMPPGYSITSHGAVVATADVELGVEWTAWDWNTAQLVGATAHGTLQRAAPGGRVRDSETVALATTHGAIDERFRFRSFEGQFDTLTSAQRAAIADDFATALGVFLVTPGFDGIARIELCFVLPAGTFERFVLERDVADPTVLVVRPQSP